MPRVFVAPRPAALLDEKFLIIKFPMVVLYRPSNDLVVCRDPLCFSELGRLHVGCDCEVEYADGGSSLRVLANDIFTLNVTSGVRMSPRCKAQTYMLCPGVASFDPRVSSQREI